MMISPFTSGMLYLVFVPFPFSPSPHITNAKTPFTQYPIYNTKQIFIETLFCYNLKSIFSARQG
jgi:hypothetical protein